MAVRLMREAQADLAIRRFIGCGLHERLPDHSSPARIRQRRGDARFRWIFERAASACVEAGIAQGEVVHVDATPVRADAGWESMVDRHAGAAAAENGDAEEDAAPPGAKRKKADAADPDASLAASSRGRRLEPSYKQHAAVDDGSGVVPDVAAATGEVNERNVIEDQVDEVRRISGKRIGTAAADAGYACGKACGGLERRGIDPAVPAKREPTRSRVPACRFRCYERNNIVKCPRGKALRPGQPFKDGQMRFHAGTRDCAGCPLRGNCVPGSRNRKTVAVSADHPALLRARRRRLRWSEEDRRLYRRHRWRSEGFHGEAKTWHGLGRVARLGQHEDPALPGGRRDQPEAARGRFLRQILRNRHDSSARNGPFRAPGAAGRAWPSHARPRCPAPRGKTPLRPPPRFTPESSEGRVIQRPLSSEVPPSPGHPGGAAPPGTREKPKQRMGKQPSRRGRGNQDLLQRLGAR